MTETTQADLVLAIRELTDQVRDLSTRLSSLEARMEVAHPTGELPDDLVLVIAAACAAYLGKRATVRQVRLHRHTTWAKQGRSDVQHSHVVMHTAP